MAAPKPADPSHPEAAALLAQLQSVRSAMEGAASHAGSGVAHRRLAATLSEVIGIETSLAQALQAGGSLATIDLSAITRLIEQSQVTLTAAEAATATDTATAAANLAATSIATRREVQTLSRDLYERRIFDSYLHFGSAADEAAHRAREADRQRLIAADLASHTPDRDLRAAIREAGQMADAGSHGANASPDFGPHWRQLVETIHRQRAAMQAAGRSTENDDQLLRAELRRSLQGLPPDQLERILNADDPLAAATPLLTAAQAARLEIQLDGQPPALPSAAKVDHGPAAPSPPTAASTADDDALISTGLNMLAAGVRPGAAAPSGDGHGLAGAQPHLAASRAGPVDRS